MAVNAREAIRMALPTNIVTAGRGERVYVKVGVGGGNRT